MDLATVACVAGAVRVLGVADTIALLRLVCGGVCWVGGGVWGACQWALRPKRNDHDANQSASRQDE